MYINKFMAGHTRKASLVSAEVSVDIVISSSILLSECLASNSSEPRKLYGSGHPI